MPTAIKQFISVKTDNLSIRRKAAFSAFVAVFLFVLPVTGVFLYTRGRASAAASSTLNFQARLLDNNGSLVADGSYNIQFNLYTAESGGTTQWTESYLVSATQGVTVKNGYFSVNLGSITSFPTNIAWDQEQWLGMTVRGTTSCVFGSCTPTDAEMTPRFKLTAVPYAFRAGSIMDAAGTAAFTADDLIQKSPTSPQVVNTALAAIRLNQTNSGGLLQLQNTGVDKFTVDNSGSVVAEGSLTVSGGTATLGSVAQAGSLVLNDGSLNTTTLQAGSSVSNLIFTLPSNYGNSGDCLTGDGAGGITFMSNCGGTLSVNPVANLRKSVDQTQTNATNPTATLTNDSELFFAIGANETWSFRFSVIANANTAPDIKFAVTAPTGATCKVHTADPEGATSVANLGCGVSTGSVPGNSTDDLYEVSGTVINGSTPGNVTLQWAQNTASANATIVRAGSFLHADRIAGPGQTAQAFIQNGNSFGALATIGTNDNNALSVETNGIERLRILASGEIVAADDVIAQGAATATTGTSAGSGATNTTTVTLASAGSFANNDIIYIDNVGGSGEDYYTRIISGAGTTTITVSPAVSYGTAAGYTGNATITKYTTQNIGATTTDYSTQANRFFQGYFLGGVTVGAGSTTLSDGLLSRTYGDIVVEPGIGGVVQVVGTLNVTTLNATTLSGDGSSITNINGANITSGSIPDSALSSNVTLLNATQTFSAVKTFSAGLTITAGQSLSLNGDVINDLTGTGLLMNAGSLETTLGTSVDLSSEITGTLAIANGGTGATSQQGAINALSGLTTNGDLLYNDGTNTTRLARGTTGQCLTSNGTTILWGSCTTGAVTTVGTLDSQVKSANGAVITAGSLVLQTADASNAGLVSTGVQTFAGDKTFNGQIIGAAGLSVDGGAISLNVTGTAATSVGNSTGTLTLTGGAASTINVNGITIDATELSRLDGKDAALVDTNDAVATAITGTGALTSGSIGGSFGNINIGTNTFTGNGSGLTSLNGTNISSGTISNTVLTNSGALTVTAGTGLTGGGSVALGSSISLSVAYGSTAGTAVQGDTTLVCPSGSGNLTGGGNTITLGTGGTCGSISTNNAVSFSTSVTTPSLASATGLSITSGGTGDITLNSASNITIIDSTDTTLRRTAAGTYTIELNDAAATTLALNNTGAGAVSINLTDGGLQTAGTQRLSNAGVLQNITGLTITSGGASVTGTSSFASDTSFNANITIGDATTDRLTLTSQILGGSPLVFQGATDNSFTTTFTLVDPTANNTITIPNESGIVTLIAPAASQTDSGTGNSLFINKTGASGSIVLLRKSGTDVFTINNNGDLLVGPSTDSATAFKVKDASSNAITTVDTSAKRLLIGSDATDTLQVLLQLDSFSTFTETAGCSSISNQGAMYYNTSSSELRACVSGAWEDLATTHALGLLLFGVVPDSSNAVTPGDIGGISGLANGPCAVTWNAAQSVRISPCIAYSGGRKVSIAGGIVSTAAIAANAYVNICLTGTSNQPALGTANATETSASVPSFSPNNPVVCLATLRMTGTAGNVGNIFDTRTFTNTDKQFVTINSVSSPGMIAISDNNNANRVVTTTTTSAGGIRGVIVATSGAASTNTINGIIATSGSQYLKIVPGATATPGTIVQTFTTAGYSRTSANFTNSYSSAGILVKGIDTACTTTANCQYSGLVDLSISR